MSESEETKWRLGAEPEEAMEKAAELSAEEDEKKEELQQSIQTNAEEIGRGGEGSLIARPQEVPITEARKKKQRIAKAEHPTVKIKPDSSKSMVKISKQLERQAARLARIEKIVLPLQYIKRDEAALCCRYTITNANTFNQEPKTKSRSSKEEKKKESCKSIKEEKSKRMT